MKIAIDCRHIDASGGIGVYTRECLPYFLGSANDFLLLGDKDKLAFVKGHKNAEIIHCGIKPFSLRDTFVFSGKVLKKINQCDLYYSPYFNIPCCVAVPVFITIHDIIFPDMPDLVSLPGLWARMFFYRRAARLASVIFTVSEFSKSRIEYNLGKKTPVINASNAVNTSYTANLQKGIAKKKHIIFIGNIKKHKGLNILLDAYLSARADGLDYDLVIVGGKDNFRSKDREISSRLTAMEKHGVIFTGHIQDSEKWLLLAESALLVQPSLYEGFAYPPLEAMLAGTPVLISDIPVFREVYGEFPVTFFKKGDSADLKAKLMELLCNKDPKALVLPARLREKYNFGKVVTKILNSFIMGNR